MPRGLNPSKVQQWTDRLERFDRSGQTVAQFCQLEGVSQPSFYQWKKKLAALAGQPSLQAKSSPPAFRAVEVIQTNPEVTPPNQAATTIRLANGIEIELGGDLRIVQAVVKQLLEAPAAAATPTAATPTAATPAAGGCSC